MEEIYSTISQYLQENQPELKHIDWDNGQLEIQPRPPLNFPAVLIAIEINSCEDMGHSGAQLCHCNITLRIANNIYDNTSTHTPAHYRKRAMWHHTVAANIYKLLQCYTPGEKIGEIKRINAKTEKRNDGLAVLTATYQCQYFDDNSAVEKTTSNPVPPSISYQQ